MALSCREAASATIGGMCTYVRNFSVFSANSQRSLRFGFFPAEGAQNAAGFRKKEGRGSISPRPCSPRQRLYDFFSIMKLVLVPRCLSLYSAVIDFPSAETVMRKT